MASFDENGKYIKTNWKAGDKITATKLNKIEESIEAVNDNDISRHVEADARLDALEAKDTAQDKELTNIKNTIADNKAAAELGDYDINSRMTFLEEELNDGIEEVHNVASTVDGKIAQAVTNVNNVASTVDGKIATAEVNMAAQVNQGKADMEAMVAEVEGNITEIQNDVSEIRNKYTTCDFTHNDFYGSIILNNGFTLKWGRLEFGPNYTADTTIDYIFTFPEPFTIGVWMLNYSLAGGDNGWDGICAGYPIDRTRSRLVVRGINPTMTTNVYWLAIGM